MPTAPSSAEITYAFVDGGYLRDKFRACMLRYFGVEILPDIPGAADVISAGQIQSGRRPPRFRNQMASNLPSPPTSPAIPMMKAMRPTVSQPDGIPGSIINGTSGLVPARLMRRRTSC